MTPTDSDPNLDPESFRVPASDAHGHSERHWFRIQPGADRQLDSILQSRFFPYRSKGDIIRHAVHRHIEWLETQAPVPSVTAQVGAILEVVREEEFNEDFKQVFAIMTERVMVYVGQGDLVRAKSLVSRVLDKIQQMPEGAWKDQYHAELMARFHYLMGDIGSEASLIPDEAEED